MLRVPLNPHFQHGFRDGFEALIIAHMAAFYRH